MLRPNGSETCRAGPAGSNSEARPRTDHIGGPVANSLLINLTPAEHAGNWVLAGFAVLVRELRSVAQPVRPE
jgi:hypothetical protein